MVGIAMLMVDEYIVDVLMRDLVGHDRRPVSFLVYLWLAAEQQRQGSAVTVSYQQLAESVGISKSSAQAAAGWLARRKALNGQQGRLHSDSQLLSAKALVVQVRS